VLLIFLLLSFKSHANDFAQWSHQAIGIKKAWSLMPAGQRGAGVRVLVLDTGVDATHPELLGKIEKVRDFVSDPIERAKDTRGHGTFTSGVIAALDDQRGITGAAPEATLLMGRVCSSLCAPEDIVRGLEWALEERVDIVSLSLSSRRAVKEVRLAAEKLERAGILVIASIGNNASPVAGFPAGFETVFAVGGVDSTNRMTASSNWGHSLDVVAPGQLVLSSFLAGEGRRSSLTTGQLGVIESYALINSATGALSATKIVYVGEAKESDFAGKDLKGHIALIDRGVSTFVDMYQRAFAAGASGIILANTDDRLDTFKVDTEQLLLPFSLISKSSGKLLRDEITRGRDKVSFNVEAWDYSYASGNSVATPLVSAIAALVKSVNLTLRAEEIRSILRNSTRTFPFYTMNRYGFGLIDAEKAVQMSLAF
jgi:subtilisin family serine protease